MRRPGARPADDATTRSRAGTCVSLRLRRTPHMLGTSGTSCGTLGDAVEAHHSIYSLCAVGAAGFVGSCNRADAPIPLRDEGCGVLGSCPKVQRVTKCDTTTMTRSVTHAIDQVRRAVG